MSLNQPLRLVMYVWGINDPEVSHTIGCDTVTFDLRSYGVNRVDTSIQCKQYLLFQIKQNQLCKTHCNGSTSSAITSPKFINECVSYCIL